MLPSDAYPQPLQLKGEVIDLEFSLDTDHRKRRRNRTTQSCLNCHTSKRKCDRKRPCQRCIQLGLTGLCVYEIDDPALRDDPTLDESTRLRNRIAELESLVRELRGKPHPRWAETNFRDGDPNEKWHSRATKCIPLKRGANGQPQPSQSSQPQPPSPTARTGHSLLSPIKTEPSTDTSNAHLYRFSPSPGPSLRYHTFQQDMRSSGDSGSSFDSARSTYNSATVSGMPYPAADSTNASHYSNGTASSSATAYADGTSATTNGSYTDDGNSSSSTYNEQFANPPSQPHYNCSCRSNPALGIPYITLSQTLQSTLASQRQYSNHPASSPCPIYRRMVELQALLQPHTSSGSESPGLVPHTYDSGPPSDSEIMTPLSATSSHASFHAGSPGVSPQEWNHMATAGGFNPYFPAPDHHSVYNHVNHVIS